MPQTKKHGRAFINKKKATTFKLLHRSQRDPLIADNDAGDRILHRVADGDTLEERNKYGIFYRDNYDYLRHLKEVGEVIELEGVEREIIRVPDSIANLPTTIFETKGVELKVGLLNTNAPSNELLPDVDPDVAAALEGDLSDLEDVEELEEDFMLLANGNQSDTVFDQKKRMTDKPSENEALRRFGLVREPHSNFSSDDEDEDDEDASDEDEDDGSDSAEEDLDEMGESGGNLPIDRRSHFTNYSMSSAVIRRDNGLRLIDDHFEQLYEEYGEGKIGGECGDGDEDGGMGVSHLMEPDTDRLQPLVENSRADRRRYFVEKPDDDLKSVVLAREAQLESGREATQLLAVATSKRPQWDCESILTTHSTLNNHPTLIREPATGASSRKKRRIANLRQLEQEMMETETVVSGAAASSRFSTSTFRQKHLREPTEEQRAEKRARKQAVREERRERRQEKKVNRLAFQELRQKMELAPNGQGPATTTKIRPIK